MLVALVVHFGNTEVVLAPLRHTFNSVCSLYVACAHLERVFFFPLKESVTATDKAVRRAEN